MEVAGLRNKDKAGRDGGSRHQKLGQGREGCRLQAAGTRTRQGERGARARGAEDDARGEEPADAGG